MSPTCADASAVSDDGSTCPYKIYTLFCAWKHHEMLSFKRASLALLLSSAPAVHAWGAAGHEMYVPLAT